MNAKHPYAAIFLAMALLCAGAIPARADWALLRNGERLHITGFERRGSVCILRIAGGEVSVPASAVARFEPEDVFAPAAAQAAQPSGPYAPLAMKAAQENGLSANLLSSVIRAESSNRPRAVSPKGAMGLMQLMPGTARELDVQHPFDPSENVQGGARYLKQLMNTFGHLNLALAAYNAGPAAVRLYQGIPPYPETRAYIARIRHEMKQHAAPNSKRETVELICSPLGGQCSERAVPGSGISDPGLH
jgi:soluble lytic murein transglycosylase-like protein